MSEPLMTINAEAYIAEQREQQAEIRRLRMTVWRLRELLDEALYSLTGPGSDSIRDKITRELGALARDDRPE